MNRAVSVRPAIEFYDEGGPERRPLAVSNAQSLDEHGEKVVVCEENGEGSEAEEKGEEK